MKKQLSIIGGLVVLCLAMVMVGRASSYTFLGTLATVNNTTSNSTGLAISTLSGSGSIYVQNGGLTATNALRVNVQLSVDNTNFVTVATYWPAATNATTELYYPSFSTPLYLRTQAVTTNNVTVGVVYQY